MKKIFNFFLQNYSNLHERCGMFWNKRKIKFQIFPIFNFLVMATFWIQNMVNFQKNFTITRRKKIGFIFSFIPSFQHFSQLFGPKNQNGSFWGGGCRLFSKKYPLRHLCCYDCSYATCAMTAVTPLVLWL